MIKKDLVSIITPCYNGEEYIDQYAKSILNQTYNKLELIFINDGSTDSTEEKILSYQKQFEEKGIRFIYKKQENKGQAAAINVGLKIFEGEFLIWPDSDDVLHKDSIEKNVNFLQHHNEYALVRDAVDSIDFATNQIISTFRLNPNKVNESIFEDLIFENDVFYAPVSYMVRTKEFLEANPTRTIFETRFGQNWQMLLPITHKNKCGYIDEILCDYYVRANSHSRQKTNDFQKEIYKIDKHIEILQKVLR